MCMSEDRKFHEIMEDYCMRYLELNPILATILGVHIFDSQMPRGDKKGILELRNLLVDFKNALAEINRDRLSFDFRIDYDLLHDLINLRLFEIDELQLWKKYPFAAENIGDAIFPLFIREFAPFSERFSSIVARLEKCPRYLRESMECLEEPVKIYIDAALRIVNGLPAFLDAIYSAGISEFGEEDQLVKRAKYAIENLKSELMEYEEWLKDKYSSASDNFAIGYDKFRKLLELRGLEYSPGELIKLGEKYLNMYKRELTELAKKISPDGDVNKARELIENEHPKNFKEAISEYIKLINKAKKFVIDNKLAPIPEEEEIKVLETPEFLRPIIPFAAYYPPAPFEDRKIGIYLVTKPVNEEFMKRHNYYAIANTTIHEAYPGHHLQSSWVSRNFARILSGAVEYIEGWAHYCEDLMKEYGFEATDKHKFIQLLDNIWRAVRVILDVKLSTGQISFEEAVDFLVKETGMGREAAKAEVMRYTYTPGYQLSYLVGKHLISQLREEIKEKLGERYNDYDFHNIILTSGIVPFKYLRKIVYSKLGIK